MSREEINQITLDNLKLVYEVYNREFSLFREESEDLIQSGYLGLHRASVEYNPDRGYQFSTLAYRYIKYAMMDYVNQKSNLSVPRRQVCKFVKANQLMETGINPTEAIKRSELTKKTYLSIRVARNPSLEINDQTVHDYYGDSIESYLSETVYKEQLIDTLLRGLKKYTRVKNTDKYQRLLWYIAEGLNLNESSKKINVSRQRGYSMLKNLKRVAEKMGIERGN